MEERNRLQIRFPSNRSAFATVNRDWITITNERFAFPATEGVTRRVSWQIADDANPNYLNGIHGLVPDGFNEDTFGSDYPIIWTALADGTLFLIVMGTFVTRVQRHLFHSGVIRRHARLPINLTAYIRPWVSSAMEQPVLKHNSFTPGIVFFAIKQIRGIEAFKINRAFSTC